MLAQNFKTAEELNLSNELHRALIKVLVRLETNDLVHIDPQSKADRELPNGFNMKHMFKKWEEWGEGCGTVGCICGWAAYEMGVYPEGIEDKYPHLEPLFYPCHNKMFYPCYGAINTDQAAQVLRHYLTTGVIDWESALTDLFKSL